MKLAKKVTKAKSALFIATQNGKLEDVCRDIWHVLTIGVKAVSRPNE